ncbi:MAG: NDMA-dependent alcohol dehydrogenase [Gordonia sp. (in: high G+C Gram-positive bacteria)]|uniref:NDMA-dependent alcohol dehydrogenase n=1 Tax=Gordonia sp. (in: high G+C Gram-positive bacteria) TaxID=84139 RepID=UPI0039E4FE28
MKTKAAVVREVGKPMEIEELEVVAPGPGQVLVRFLYAGMCHSDVHIQHGDLPARLPMVMGHEGAGVIEEVGPGVTRVAVGDHIVCSFIPSCGTCHWCSTGQQPMCDMGATILEGYLPDGRFPLQGKGGEDIGTMCMLGTFSQYGTVSEKSVVKIAEHLPMDKAVLVGCGVPTGWGAAVNAANVRPGDTVIVAGIGGIGSNAVQGARMAGAKNLIAVDPLENKRDFAKKMGATHAFATMAEAADVAKADTNGNGAHHAILTAGLVTEELIDEAFDATGKGSTIVIVGQNTLAERSVHVPGAIMTLYKKTIKGTNFGDCNPMTDINRLLGMYDAGDLILDELITRTYTLEEVNQGYDDLLAGKNIRGVIVHEH